MVFVNQEIIRRKQIKMKERQDKLKQEVISINFLVLKFLLEGVKGRIDNIENEISDMIYKVFYNEKEKDKEIKMMREKIKYIEDIIRRSIIRK